MGISKGSITCLRAPLVLRKNIFYWVVYSIYICYCIYMAKKYLLYIHNPRFELEERKSGLVNELLDGHYTKHVYDTGKAPKSVQEIIDKPVEKVIQNVKEVFGDAVTFCKHGYDPRFCKHAKPGKPCR